MRHKRHPLLILIAQGYQAAGREVGKNFGFASKIEFNTFRVIRVIRVIRGPVFQAA